MKRALVTGVCGQDGSYLTEFLLNKGYRVFGLTHRMIEAETFAMHHHIHLLNGDMRDELSLRTAITKSWPDEIYNLAGQVFVPVSWEAPAETFDINTCGLARILKIVKEVKPDTKVYQASSSEMFGNYDGCCSEETAMWPTSPYGISKLASHKLCERYRERDVFVVSGILFNHESPRRGHEMVTRKISAQVAAWANGDDSRLGLGNLNARRDWGYAKEYVEAMWLMLQQDQPDDYVVGTGVSHSVAEFLMAAGEVVGLERAFVLDHLEIDNRMTRTQEIYNLRADNSKTKRVLHWEPKVDFDALVKLMVHSEMTTLTLNGRRAMVAR